MKKLTAFFILLAAFVGNAVSAPPTPKCWPDFTTPVSLEIAVGPPKVVPVGTTVYSASSVGLVYGWACAASDGTWYKYVVAGRWSEFAPDWLWKADTLARGTDADRNSAWSQYVKDTMDPVFDADVASVKAMLPSPAPPSAWKVLADPFRADKKRVVYTVVNGKRGAATTQLVAAGEPCNPVTTITEYGPTYYLSVLGNPALVARCVKQ